VCAKRRTTIQDVAIRAQVAPITVSRVVNNSGYVGQAVRERVQAAIQELGYVPNSLARGLRSRRTNTIALVLTDITNPFFTTMARGVEDAASDAGLMMLVCNTDEREEKELSYLRMLLQKRADGVLLVPARSGAQSLRLLRDQGVLTVVLDRRVADADTDVVRCDSERGAYELGRLLVSLGHRRVAVMAGPTGVSTSDDRVAGCMRALTEAGAADSCRVYRGELVQYSGADMAKKALAASPPPTALFAANNFIAIGALGAMHELGVRVPEDVALVAFDDLPPSLVTFPFLTVAAQPAYEMGRTAVQLLIDRLNGTAPKGRREIILPTEIIVRRSSGDPINGGD